MLLGWVEQTLDGTGTLGMTEVRGQRATVGDGGLTVGIPLRLALAALGMTSVAPLLAWVYDLGPFHVWFWSLTVPGAVATVTLAVRAKTRSPGGELHRLLSVAVVAGLIGTFGYDLFRVPFMVLGGLRLLSPIESYGVLLVDGSTSSGLSDFAGWTYHFSNGVGFAITYAALAARRHWGWGVAWAMMLETGTLLTPFAADYGLHGKYDVIAIAYAAHVPYGLALGLMLRRPERTFKELHEATGSPGTWLLTATVVAVALWLAPWNDHEPAGLSPEADAAIIEGRLVPEFIRLEGGSCARVENFDSVDHTIEQAEGTPVIAAGAIGDVCLSESGVSRLRVTGNPYDGGFVIIEDWECCDTD